MEIRKAGLQDYRNIGDLYFTALKRMAPSKIIFECLMFEEGFVAYDGDTLVGFCYWYKFAPDIAELKNITIDERYRNRGLGSSLLEQAENAIKENYKALILTNSMLHPHKERSAREFYLKNNYTLAASTENTLVFFKNLS